MPSHPSNTKSRLIRLSYPFFMKYRNCFFIACSQSLCKSSCQNFIRGRYLTSVFTSSLSLFKRGKLLSPVLSFISMTAVTVCSITWEMMEDFIPGQSIPLVMEWGEDILNSDLMKSCSEISQDMRASPWWSVTITLSHCWFWDAEVHIKGVKGGLHWPAEKLVPCVAVNH